MTKENIVLDVLIGLWLLAYWYTHTRKPRGR